MLWLLLGARRWTPTTVMLVGGSVFYLLADFAYTVRIDQGTIDDPSLNWLDTLWLVAYGLYLLAALHPSARLLGRTVPSDDRPISRGRLALSGLTLLAPMIALAIGGTDLPHLAVRRRCVEVALVVLVLLRLSDLAAGERRARQAVHDRERYFRSLVQNSSEAMLVVDGTGVVRDASPAVKALLGHRPAGAGRQPGRRRGRRPSTGAAAESLLARTIATPDVVITAEFPITIGVEHPLARDAGDQPARGPGRRRPRGQHPRRDGPPPGPGRPRAPGLHRLAHRPAQPGPLPRSARPVPQPARPARPGRHLLRPRRLQGRQRPTSATPRATACSRSAAARLAAAVRAEDTVARLGGDEFAVLISGADALEVAEEIAGRIVEELRRPLMVGSETVPVSVSVGVACAPGRLGRGRPRADALRRRGDVPGQAGRWRPGGRARQPVGAEGPDPRPRPVGRGSGLIRASGPGLSPRR